MDILEKSENFNSLRPILFELCKKNLQGGGEIEPPPSSRNRVKSEFVMAKQGDYSRIIINNLYEK